MIDNIELYKALAKARTEFTKVKFDSVNPHFKNKFASLASMHDATVDALSANGLTILQLPTDLDGQSFYVVAVKGRVGNSRFQVMLGASMGLLGVVIVFARHPMIRIALCSVNGIYVSRQPVQNQCGIVFKQL